MVAVAATLFAVNGTISKVILGSGIDSQQLTEVRCAGALMLIVEVWHGGKLSAAGVAAAGLAAITYATYVLLAERGVRRRDPLSLSAWGFLFATLFWSVLAPWWNFPAGRVGDDVSLLGNLASAHLPVWSLMVWMVVLGTIVPFALVVGALRHITATRAGITAMLEPVVAIRLVRAARGHSADVIRRQYFAQGSVAARAVAAGARGPVSGEDLAWAAGLAAQGAVTQWLAGPAHRAVLLRPGFHRVGIGIV